VFEGLGSTKEEGTTKRDWVDPHVLRAPDDKGEVVPVHGRDPVARPDAAVGQWSLIQTGLLGSDVVRNEGDRASVANFATVQNDKYLEATERVVANPSGPLGVAQNEGVYMRWDSASRAVGFALRRIAEHPKSQKPPRAASLIASIRPHVEHRVSQQASELLTGGEDGWARAAEEYAPMMVAVARAVAPAATVADTERRRRIAAIRPEFAAATTGSADDTQDEEGGETD